MKILDKLKRFFKTKREQKCPSPIKNKEAHFCGKARTILSKNSPVKLSDTKQFVFINKPSSFKLCQCINGNLATIEQLKGIAPHFKVCGRYLCPMKVWTTKNKMPTMVKIKPGKKRPVKIVKTKPLNCRAFCVCVMKNE